MARLSKRLYFPLAGVILFFTVFSFPIVAFWLSHGVFSRPLPVEQTLVYNYQHPDIPRVDPALAPSLSSSHYVLLDEATNSVLLSQNPDSQIYPASITKLATALTALNVYPLDEEITVKDRYEEGKIMELVPGEKITVRSLVTALLVFSANDAAYNLARHYPEGVDGFVTQMNNLVSRYGLTHTHFVNFDGIHHPNHYSTVFDLAQLGRLSIQNPIVRQLVKTKQITIFDIDHTHSHELTSTNELLGVIPEVEGLKTGWTPEAGGCFIGLLNINGHYLISVIAQSEDRFADTQLLIDWAKSHVSWSPYQP